MQASRITLKGITPGSAPAILAKAFSPYFVTGFSEPTVGPKDGCGIVCSRRGGPKVPFGPRAPLAPGPRASSARGRPCRGLA